MWIFNCYFTVGRHSLTSGTKQLVLSPATRSFHCLLSTPDCRCTGCWLMTDCDPGRSEIEQEIYSRMFMSKPVLYRLGLLPPRYKTGSYPLSQVWKNINRYFRRLVPERLRQYAPTTSYMILLLSHNISDPEGTEHISLFELSRQS